MLDAKQKARLREMELATLTDLIGKGILIINKKVIAKRMWLEWGATGEQIPFVNWLEKEQPCQN